MVSCMLIPVERVAGFWFSRACLYSATGWVLIYLTLGLGKGGFRHFKLFTVAQLQIH